MVQIKSVREWFRGVVLIPKLVIGMGCLLDFPGEGFHGIPITSTEYLLGLSLIFIFFGIFTLSIIFFGSVHLAMQQSQLLFRQVLIS